MDTKVIYPELSYLLYGFCFKIHNELGRYKNEKQYADAFENILINNKISYLREKALPSSFEGEQERRSVPDFIIENKIIVDFKAKRIITKEDYFQMKRYLNSYNAKLGLIINFHQKFLTPKRILN